MPDIIHCPKELWADIKNALQNFENTPQVPFVVKAILHGLIVDMGKVELVSPAAPAFKLELVSPNGGKL